MGKGAIAKRMRRNSMTEADLQQYEYPMPSKLGVPVVKGDFDALPKEAQEFVATHVSLCKPKAVYICDGSQEEAEELTEKLVKRGMMQKLNKMDNW